MANESDLYFVKGLKLVSNVGEGIGLDEIARSYITLEIFLRQNAQLLIPQQIEHPFFVSPATSCYSVLGHIVAHSYQPNHDGHAVHQVMAASHFLILDSLLLNLTTKSGPPPSCHWKNDLKEDIVAVSDPVQDLKILFPHLFQ